MNRFALLGVALVGFYCPVRSAQAAPLQVTLGAGGATTTIVDGGAGDADFALNNSVSVVSTVVGGYSFSFSLSTGNSPGTPTLAFVDTSTASIRDVGGGATTVSVLVSANDFVHPLGSAPAFTGGTAQFKTVTPYNNTATVLVKGYIDTANAPVSSIPAGTLIGSDSAMLTQPGAPNVSLVDSSSVSLGSPYALHLYLEAIMHQAGSVIDLDGQIALMVPEPSSIGLLAVGSLGALALISRRRGKV